MKASVLQGVLRDVAPNEVHKAYTIYREANDKISTALARAMVETLVPIMTPAEPTVDQCVGRGRVGGGE